MSPANLFLVGVPRAGTTSLANALGEHDDIYLCPLKEPHYYAYPTTGFDGPGDDWLERNWCGSAEAYADQFSAAPTTVRFRLDASTNYFHDLEAMGKIIAAAPDAKFVVVLRNPVDRARSAHQFLSWQGHESLSLNDALGAESDRKARGWSQIWRYSADSHYADSLAAFLQVVPEAQRLVLLFEDLDDWAGTRSRILEFLGLSPAPLELRHLNAKGAAPGAGVAKLLNRPSDLRTKVGNSALGRLLQPLLNTARKLASRTAAPTEISSLPIAVLESWATDCERVESLLGRDLPGWPTTKH